MYVAQSYWRENCKMFFQQAYTFSVENDRKVNEDVDVSVKGNFVQYHVKDNDTEVWVINDYNTVSIEYWIQSIVQITLTSLVVLINSLQ